MKKIALFMLIISSVFILIGCTDNKNPVNPNLPNPGTEEPEPEKPEPEKPEPEKPEPVEPEPEKPEPEKPEPVEPEPEIKYTVEFYVENDLYYSYKLEPNQLASNMTAPYIEDVIFESWLLNDKPYNFNNEVKSSIRLDAKYVKDLFANDSGNENNKPTVYYYVDGNLHSFNEIVDNKIENIKAPYKEGYEFLYWSVDGKEFDFSLYQHSTISLYAKYKRNILSTSLFTELPIYYITDTHGALLENDGEEIGLSKISGFLNERRIQNSSESIFITGGDMFQGQIISNDSKGESMVAALNQMQVDAFVLGNHEFDWGLDTILEYKNPNNKTGVVANFPILGANVLLKSSNQRPKYVDPYVIVEKNNSKIGIIGVMGDGLETSISSYRVKDYYFSDAYEAVRRYAEIIADEVDLIIVSAHSYDERFNEKVTKLPKVQALFTAHTHRPIRETINGIPSLQAANNGRYVGEINLGYKINNNILNLMNYNTLLYNKTDGLFTKVDEVVEEVINYYYNNVKNIYEDVILTSKSSYDQKALSEYMAKLMRVSTNAVVGIQNNGGTRSTFSYMQQLTGADIFKVYPFDNKIIYFQMKGSDLKYIMKNSSLTINRDYSETIYDFGYYTVATNDYIFYSYDQFNTYRDSGNYALYGDMYEVLMQELELLKQSGKTLFNTSDEIQTTPLVHYN